MIEELEKEMHLIMGYMTEMHRVIDRIGEKGGNMQEIAASMRHRLNDFSQSVRLLNNQINRLKDPPQDNETKRAFRAFIDTIQEVKK